MFMGIDKFLNTTWFISKSLGILAYEGIYYKYHNDQKLMINNIIEKVKTMNIIYVKMFQLISSSIDIIDKDTQTLLIKYTDNVDYSTNVSELVFQYIDLF